jgi:hypothetical protein
LIEGKGLTRWEGGLLVVLRIRSEVDARQLLERRSAALLFWRRALEMRRRGRRRMRHVWGRKAVGEAVEGLRVVVGHGWV